MIKINGYTLPNIVVGTTYKESLEDELNSLAVVYYDDDKPTYQAHDIAVVDNRKWVIGNYQSDLIARHPIKYKTILMLVELTKLLERFIIGPCSFTSKGDTLKGQMVKALNQAEVLRVGESSRFVFENDLHLLTSAIEGEEFFFNSQMTLREVLDKMLAVANCRVVLTDIDADDKYHLSFRDLNKQSEDIKEIKGDIVGENVNQNMEYLAGEYETLVRNALSKDRRVMTEEWQTLKPTSIGVADTESMRLVVSMPIEEVIKIELYVVAMVGYGNIGTVPAEYEDFVSFIVDITDLFIEKEIFDAMSLPEQEKHIPYLRGSKEIGALDTFKRMFFSQSKLNNKIREVYLQPATQSLIDKGVLQSGITFDPIQHEVFNIEFYGNSITDLYLFQTSYVPYIDLHFSQTKENATLSMPSKMISNQTDETIEVGRYSSSLRALANKLGNKVTEKSVILLNKPLEELKADILELGDRIDEDNTLISREYSVFEIPFQPHIKIHYVFVEHYSNVLATKLSRERRLYNIPIENIIERDVLVKDYLILSTGKDLKTDSLLDNNITLPYFLKTFRNTNDDDTSLDRLYFTTNFGTNENGFFSLPLLGSAVGKSMYWQAKCYDNFSVGLSTNKWVIGGKEVYQNPYVDANGEFEFLNFWLIKSNLAGLNYTDRAVIGKALPVVPIEKHDIYLKRDFTNGSKNILVNKDGFERFGFSYQLEPMTKKADYGKIIIGDSFSKYSNLLYGKNETPLYVWTSNESYRTNETRRCKGSRQSYKPVIDTTNYKVSPEVIPQTLIKSWAIGDVSGNLILAVNNNFAYVDVYFTLSRNMI